MAMKRNAKGQFLKGQGGPGRPPGTMNKINRSFREATLAVFNRMGEAEGISGVEAFLLWARKEPSEFYRIAARLIPQELSVKVEDLRPLVIDTIRVDEIEAERHNGAQTITIDQGQAFSSNGDDTPH